MTVDMKNEIFKLQWNVREKLVLEMRRCVSVFKDYVTGNYDSEHPNYNYDKGRHYGCKDNIYYYWVLPEVVDFIYQNNHYRAEWIFFNDKFKCWLVYDSVKKEYVAFEALDTDSQITLFRMLESFVDYNNWSYHY